MVSISEQSQAESRTKRPPDKKIALFWIITTSVLLVLFLALCWNGTKRLVWWPGVLVVLPFGMVFVCGLFALRPGVARRSIQLWCLASATFICIQLFALPMCQLKPEYRPKQDQPPWFDDPQVKFMLAEHQKVVDEIKLRIEAEDTWFRYKFILVGGLFAAFLTHLYRKSSAKPQRRSAATQPTAQASPEQTASEVRPKRTFKRLSDIRVCWVLALACVIALTIDIHVRLGATVTNQLGNWIAYHAEVYFLGNPNATGGPNITPYEQFLRLPGSMHSSELYEFSYWPHVHFLTWFLYMLYLLALQANSRGKAGPANWLLLPGYILVQITFCAFAWCAHLAPENFELQMPFFNSPLSGWQPPLAYLCLGLLLATVNLPYAWKRERA